jgi:phosphate transport system substrate-binding protein
MDQMMKIRFVVLLVLVGFLGCYEEPKQTPTKGNLDIEIDETVAPVMDSVVNEFGKLYPDAKVKSNVKTAREVITDLLNEKVNLVISSRDFNSEEKSIISSYNLDVGSQKVAIDGIVIIVNKNNPIKQIDVLQLNKVFSGESTSWKNLNKSLTSDKIQIFGETPNAGGYEYIKDKILNGKDFVKTAYPCTTSIQIIDMVSRYENSIGWVGLSWNPGKNKEVKVLEVAAFDSTSVVQNYYEPHRAHIYRKYYPLIRSIYILSRDVGYGVASGFITYATHEGQKTILNLGIVPAIYPVRLIQLGSQ